jgi:hypothetical protein
MTFAFDLWSLPDVQAHVADILERLVNGTMPCDSVWPSEKMEVFKRWTEVGFPPQLCASKRLLIVISLA